MGKKRNLPIVIVFVFVMLSLFTACDNKTAEPPHEHIYEEKWSKNDTHHWYAASCEHKEEKQKLAEHTFDEGEITTKPTYGEDGVRTYTCTVCGATKTESVEAHEAKNGDVVLASDYSLDKPYDGLAVQLTADNLVRIENEEAKPVALDSIESIRFKVKDEDSYLEAPPINAGSYTAEVVVKDTAEWNGGTYSFDFDISKVVLSGVVYHPEHKVYENKPLSFSDLIVDHEIMEAVIEGEEIVFSEIKLDNYNAGNHNATAKGSGIENYDIDELCIIVTIEKALIENCTFVTTYQPLTSAAEELKSHEVPAKLPNGDTITIKLYPYNINTDGILNADNYTVYSLDLPDALIAAYIRESRSSIPEKCFIASIVDAGNNYGLPSLAEKELTNDDFRAIGKLEIKPVIIQGPIYVTRAYDGTNVIEKSLDNEPNLSIRVTMQSSNYRALYESHVFVLNGNETSNYKIDNSEVIPSITQKELILLPTYGNDSIYMLRIPKVVGVGPLGERTLILGNANGVVGREDIKVKYTANDWELGKTYDMQSSDAKFDIIGDTANNYKIGEFKSLKRVICNTDYFTPTYTIPILPTEGTSGINTSAFAKKELCYKFTSSAKTSYTITLVAEGNTLCVVDANGKITTNNGDNECSFYVEDEGVVHYVHFFVEPNHSFKLGMSALKFKPKM